MLIAAAQRELRRIEPALLIGRAQTMSERIDDSVAPRRLNLVLFGLFSSLAPVLAAVGLYGVVAYASGQRTQEFGIRMALGAQSSDVLRLVLGQGLKLALIGVAIGNGCRLRACPVDDQAALRSRADGPAYDDRGSHAAGVCRRDGVLDSGPSSNATRITPTEVLRVE